MRIAVAGKGGAGKTTISGTLCRALARAGNQVLALDADSNPMLGISLGVGPEETDRLVAIRQALDAGVIDHEPTAEGLVGTFGTGAPDGVRLVVVSRIDSAEPGWPWCGVSPEQLLGELEGQERIVVCDLEAGIGTVVRAGEADVVLVVAEPSAKSIDVARRAAELASPAARVIVVANGVRDGADVEAVRSGVGDYDLVTVPHEPAIEHADREGVAPIDVDQEAPGVRAIVALAETLLPDARSATR